METNKSDGLQFDEQKSLQIIKEMIEVSQKRLNINGILFIIWGWLLFLGNFVSYIEQKVVILYPINKVLDYSGISMLILVLAFSIYFIIKQNNRVRTYIDLSLRYVWVSMFCSLVIINLIQANVVHEINFELQHPIFMVVIALATVISGGILRYKMLIFGGIFFGAMALGSSYLALPEQLLLESVAWLIAFILPGHYLYAKRKNR